MLMYNYFSGTDDGKKIYPCGAIANSMFSDDISLHYHSPAPDNTVKPVSLIRTGIAWDSDKKFKFKNPRNYNETSPMWKDYTKPKGKLLGYYAARK